MQTARLNSERAAALLGVTGTLAVIMPAFLTGALAVQIRDGLAMSEGDLGLAIGSFFVGSAGGSIVLGRLAERLGPRLGIRVGLAVTVLASLAVATVVTGPRSLHGILVVAGLANALTQPAINLMLVQVVRPERLGRAMALKQSGMPGAALVGGLAVPVIALTIGWRAAYVMAAVVACAAGLFSGYIEANNGGENGDLNDGGSRWPSRLDRNEAGRTARPVPTLGWPMLGLMAAVGALGGGAANILVGYLVSGAVDAGVQPGHAGLLLTFGAALGIGSRLFHGWLADRGELDALARVIALFLLGAVGALLLAVQDPTAYLFATPLAFAAGWAWPGLFNLVVVNANRSAPAAATGVTQTGVYIGSLASPIIAGILIERSGYPAAWLLTSFCLLGAGLLATFVRRNLVPVAGQTGGSPDGSLTSRRAGRSPVQKEQTQEIR